jgi:hypothetical protein
LCGLALLFDLGRESEGELGSLTQLTLNFDSAPMRLEDLARNEQTQTGSPVMSGQWVLDLEEFFEDSTLVARVDPDPLVANEDPDSIRFLFTRGLDPHVSVLRREFERVLNQSLHGPLETGAIGANL